jgi:hypothetical protein
VTILGVPLSRDFDDLVNVVIGLLGQSLACRTDFVDDRIRRLHHSSSFTDSMGVQMMGGSKPALRQIASIRPRIVAFAMWVQFHVTR